MAAVGVEFAGRVSINWMDVGGLKGGLLMGEWRWCIGVFWDIVVIRGGWGCLLCRVTARGRDKKKQGIVNNIRATKRSCADFDNDIL